MILKLHIWLKNIQHSSWQCMNFIQSNSDVLCNIYTCSRCKRTELYLYSLAIPTTVWTMDTLFLLMLHRNSYTLRESLCSILSSIESNRIKEPVRPTPALQCTSKGGWFLAFSLRTWRIKEMRNVAYWGTPWSGHPKNWQWLIVWWCLLEPVCVSDQNVLKSLCFQWNAQLSLTRVIH